MLVLERKRRIRRCNPRVSEAWVAQLKGYEEFDVRLWSVIAFWVPWTLIRDPARIRITVEEFYGCWGRLRRQNPASVERNAADGIEIADNTMQIQF